MAKTKAKAPPKSASEATAAYQERLREAGGGRFPTLTLLPEEMARWRALEVRLGGEGAGGAKRTLLACMAAAEAQEASSDGKKMHALAKDLRSVAQLLDKLAADAD